MPTETVYVAVNWRDGTPTLHADADCLAFNAETDVREKPRAVFPVDHPTCSFCWPDATSEGVARAD